MSHGRVAIFFDLDIALMTSSSIILLRCFVFRMAFAMRPRSGEKITTIKYIAVATRVINGPGVVSNIMAPTIPRIADMSPRSPDIRMTFFSRWLSNNAVAAGVMSMATTRITPTVRSAATTAKDRSSIKK